MLNILLILVALLPQDDGTLVQYCDRIEINHFDGGGHKILANTQMIAWDGFGEKAKIIDWHPWRIKKRPTKSGDEYILRWNDRGQVRELRAKYWEETWTHLNPERENIKVVKVNDRRGWSHRKTF